MNQTNGFDDALRVISSVLFWCFGMSFVVLFLWGGCLIFADDFVYNVHSELFEITESEFHVVQYLLLLLSKAAASGAFLFPAVAIRLVLRRRKV